MNSDKIKVQLRKEIKELLSEMSDKEKAKQSKAVCAKLVEMDEFKRAGVVMAYLSLPHEIDTSQIILHAWQQGKTVVVPKISWQQRHMIAVQINSLETGFSTEAMGLKNPLTGIPVPMEDIDIVITPGLGFDKNGNRLGRGGGYFDRFFANEALRATKCGICFSNQIVDSVPMNKTDIPIDCLVAEETVLKFNSE